MEHFPIEIAQDLMVDILISNVRNRRKRSGYSTYKDDQHHGISVDMLKGNGVLDYITQSKPSNAQPRIIRYQT